MKLLVFGQTGQVAQEMARQCPKQWNMQCLDRAAADLSNPDACARIIQSSDADIVLNAAAYTAVDRAETEEELATLVNANAPAAMARAAASKAIPFVHLSTDYVFDGCYTAARAPDSPTNPLGVYGRTKLGGELGVRAAEGAHVILRTSWVFSAHGSNFVKTMLRIGGERETINVVSDQVGGPTSAADIAAALLVMAGQFHAGSGQTGTFHFSGAPDVSWADFAREIFAQAAKPCIVRDIPTSEYPTPAPRPKNSKLDCVSLHQAFDIERPDWRIGLGLVLKEMEHAA